MPFTPDAVQLDPGDDDVEGCGLPDLQGAAAHEVDPATEDGDGRRPLDRQDELRAGQPRLRGRPPSDLATSGRDAGPQSW